MNSMMTTAAPRNATIPALSPLPITRELFTPRVLRPTRIDESTHNLGFALDVVQRLRQELQPKDVHLNLAKREVRPIVGAALGMEPPDEEERNGDRFRLPWSLVPLGRIGGEAMLLRDRAFQQLLGRVRFRRDHLERFPAGYQYHLVNWLVQLMGDNQSVVLRTAKQQQVRALVTDSYTAFDDVDLLDAVIAVLGEQPAIAATARIAWMEVREESTHVRIVWGERDESLRVGDPVLRGIHVSNSEVAARSVRIEAVVLRLVCLNGMLAPSSKGAQVLRHVGDKERLLGAVREAVEDASVETERIIADFRRSLRVPIPEPAAFFAEVVKEEETMTQEDLKTILSAWEDAGAERTLFGVTNAMTAAAQALPGDRRYELESMATRVMRRELAAG